MTIRSLFTSVAFAALCFVTTAQALAERLFSRQVAHGHSIHFRCV